LQTGASTLRFARRMRVVQPGRLHVAGDAVWLTRDGEPDDHVLVAGQTMRLSSGDAVLMQPWTAGGVSRLVWRADQALPRVLRWRAALAALGARLFNAVSGALRRESDRLAAWARMAQASASRAQGCMACGESIASSGALQ
jgi:hypothetical protein